MQTQAIIKQLTPSEVFDLTLREVEKALGDQIDNKFLIKIEEDDTSPLNVLTYNRVNPGLLAVIFTKKDQTAHVVYYPGRDTDTLTLNSSDVSLKAVMNAVDQSLQQFHYQKIKKHLIVSVYGKSFSENHFVAITEINNQLTVINPKGMTSFLSNPNMEYLGQCIPNLSEDPLAAGVQGWLDTKSCGYIVAAIHAKTVADNIPNFEEQMHAINFESLVQEYAESKITVENISKDIENTAQEILSYSKKLSDKIKEEEESVFVVSTGRIEMWSEKNTVLDSSIKCLAGEVDASELPENEGTTADFVKSVKKLHVQKSKFPNHTWPNLFQLQQVDRVEKNASNLEDDFELIFDEKNGL